MTLLMSQLKEAQDHAGILSTNIAPMPLPEGQDVWDDIIYEPTNLGPDSTQRPAPSTTPGPSGSRIPGLSSLPSSIEDQQLAFPSNGNVDPKHNDLECKHRISLAEHHLDQIRNLIAEKSFQFSHLIRAAPRKAVVTRSRAAVNKLNQQISMHCRMYSRCRSRIVALGADEAILSRLQLLLPNDIEASTAIVNPNQPGSTVVKLSWIWQTAGGHRFGLTEMDDHSPYYTGPDDGGPVPTATDRLFECSLIFHISLLIYTYIFAVRRVHWLRARAQYMRWQEEVTLTRYEMQWTVAYFAYRSNQWAQNSGISPGTMSYAIRKKEMWQDRARRSDRIFRLLNDAYKSPL